MLPVDRQCKEYLKDKLLPAAKHAHEFIVDQFCKKGGCKPKFSEVYGKYASFVIAMVDTCVVQRLEKRRGHRSFQAIQR